MENLGLQVIAMEKDRDRIKRKDPAQLVALIKAGDIKYTFKNKDYSEDEVNDFIIQHKIILCAKNVIYKSKPEWRKIRNGMENMQNQSPSKKRMV